MKNQIILYLVDDRINSYQQKEKKLLEYQLPKKIIKNGKITHHPKFIKEFNKFLKQNKIIHKFQRNIIWCIIPPNFEQTDVELMRNIFEDFPIDDIKFIKETNLYQLKKRTLWINKNETYAFLTILKKNQFETYLWDQTYLLNIIEYINKILAMNKSIKRIILIGTDPNIPAYVCQLQKQTNKIVLYYEDHKNYLINKLIRHNLS